MASGLFFAPRSHHCPVQLAAQTNISGRQRTYCKSENMFIYSFLQGQKGDGHGKIGLAQEHS